MVLFFFNQCLKYIIPSHPAVLTKYYHFWCDYEFADVDIFVVLQGVPGGTSAEEPTG